MTVLPVYLVVDTSYSLVTELDAISKAILDLVNFLDSDPALSDNLLLSVISFSDDARVVVPLAPPSALVDRMPLLTASGGTNYGAALRLLRQVIQRDIGDLKTGGQGVYRPVAFFITDGSPTDADWQDALGELRSPEFSYSPTVLAIGFEAADPSVLREIAGERGEAFVLATSMSPNEAVGSIFVGVRGALGSTIESTTSGRRGLGIAVPIDWIHLA